MFKSCFLVGDLAGAVEDAVEVAVNAGSIASIPPLHLCTYIELLSST